MALTSGIEVWINGEARQVPASVRVPELLRHLGIVPDRVAVELNRTLVRKRDWENTTIETGACLEIVEFVGGG